MVRHLPGFVSLHSVHDQSSRLGDGIINPDGCLIALNVFLLTNVLFLHTFNT